MSKTSNGTLSKNHLVAECAVMLALSIAIFAISDLIPWPAWIQGGGITLFGQVPVIVLSYRRGLKAGLPTALLLGASQLLMGLSNFAWVKGAVSYLIVAVFDYLLAFGVLGLGGIFRKIKGKTVVKLCAGALISSFLRFVCHFLSGITVWSEYTQNSGGFTNFDSIIHGITKPAVIYSFTYNGGYMLPETVITVVGCIAVAAILKKELEKFNKTKSETVSE